MKFLGQDQGKIVERDYHQNTYKYTREKREEDQWENHEQDGRKS